MLMRITSRGFDVAHITGNEKALLRCERALELKDKGDYSGAQKVMQPLWKSVGERPNVQGLHPSTAAEVLLCVGIMTCWIGNKNQIPDSHENAKDLINES